MPVDDDDDDDDDDDEDDTESGNESSTISFFTDGDWTTGDLELLAVSISRIYDSRLSTYLWSERWNKDLKNRRALLKSIFGKREMRYPDPFLYEMWLDLLESGNAAAAINPLGIALPSTPVQIYQAIDLYAVPDQRCRIHKARMSSPGGFSFTGIGEILKEFRELIKDVWYRNQQERKKGDIELIKDKLDLEKSKLDYVEKYLALNERFSSGHELAINVAKGIDGLKLLEQSGKLKPVDQHIEKSDEV